MFLDESWLIPTSYEWSVSDSSDFYLKCTIKAESYKAYTNQTNRLQQTNGFGRVGPARYLYDRMWVRA